MTRKSVGTGDRINDAAVRLFAARGYAATGIRDVAEDAGLTTAALYHHMGSKQDLLVTIMRDTLHELIASAREAREGAEGPPEELAALARAHIIFNGKHILEGYVSDSEIRSLDATNRGRIVKLRDTYEELWSDVIARGVKSGDFKIDDQHLFRLAVIQMCNGVTFWYSPAGKTPLNTIADEHAEFALGMAGYQGAKKPKPARRSKKKTGTGG